ncbi:MAG TPA: exonuclease [Blastocatellia bacterium]|nr:exonuclease [Blastocatellia bacterium]
MPEIYVSTDIEADGPIPGRNSMLSFASAAFLADKRLLSTFTANLETIPGAVPDPATTEWWKTQPEAWKKCRQNLQPASVVMPQYVSWIKNLPGMPVFLAYPAPFDFMFITYYLHSFAGESPFSHYALDIKSYAMAMLKTDFTSVVKSNMPKYWFDDLPYTHVALDDAISQGALFCNMLAQNLR